MRSSDLVGAFWSNVINRREFNSFIVGQYASVNTGDVTATNNSDFDF
jgi:hypothetical protein